MSAFCAGTYFGIRGSMTPSSRTHPAPSPRDSIEAHLTIVFAALAVSRFIEHQTGWSIRKFVKTGAESEREIDD
jgi:hypothetical protein